MGSIPAWAGEPAAELPRRGRRWVYPRVGGGTHAPSQSGQNSKGLSPRGRGNLDLSQLNTSLPGSIPAWAGEPYSAASTQKGAEVYPRVGGGTPLHLHRVHDIYGLSPRGGGTRQANRNFQHPTGLSPRGRGNLLHSMPLSAAQGSIPAWAGEPVATIGDYPLQWVYPRVGGGTVVSGSGPTEYRGLSPRGRGNPLPPLAIIPCSGSIPAWAGEPSTVYTFTVTRRVYPRVGGEPA